MGSFDSNGARLQGIEEKPVREFFISAGIYVLSPPALDYLADGQPLDAPALFERIIDAGEPTAAFPLHEYWLDVGRFEEFERAQREWK